MFTYNSLHLCIVFLQLPASALASIFCKPRIRPLHDQCVSRSRRAEVPKRLERKGLVFVKAVSPVFVVALKYLVIGVAKEFQVIIIKPRE